ncbi:hypothetical protein K439DRAFT_1611601 [Ramaria rubella]|nr:hypothetical protein K439DRAFT_1611601 [Ramaria rubella]
MSATCRFGRADRTVSVHALIAAALLPLVAARTVTSRSTPPCSENNSTIPCPKPPLKTSTVVIIVVVIVVLLLATVGLFVFAVFRRRRARPQKYEAVSKPPESLALGADGAVPAAPGEMGYAAPYTYTPPSYGSSEYAPSVETVYAPPSGPPPPPSQAATHYGYSVGAI